MTPEEQLRAAYARMQAAGSDEEFTAASREFNALAESMQGGAAAPPAPTAAPMPANGLVDLDPQSIPAFDVPNASTPVRPIGGGEFQGLGYTPAPPADATPPQGMAGPPPVSAPLSESVMAGGMRGRTGGGGDVRGAAAAYAGAAVDADAAREQYRRQLAQQARDAQAVGVEDAIRMASQEEEYAAQQQRFAVREQEVQAEFKRRVQSYDAAAQDFAKEAAADRGSSRLLSGIGPAIALALGGFGASRTGRNQALDVLQARVREEADTRVRRLDAKRTHMDALDRLVWRASQESQSVEAARKTAEAGLLNLVKMRAERYAALSASRDKADALNNMVSQLEVAEADAKAAAAAATLTQLRKSQAGMSPKALLEMEGKALDNMKKAQELGGGGGYDDYLDADGKKFLNRVNTGLTNLAQLKQMLAQQLGLPANASDAELEAAVRRRSTDAIPGYERYGHEPGKALARDIRKATGIGGGTTGLDPEGTTFANALETTGIAAYAAENYNAANYEGEQARAIQDMVGNGTLGGVWHNIKRKEAKARENRKAIMQKHTLPFAREMVQRHRTNEADAPLFGGQRATPSIPGARRVGGY